MSAHYLWPSVGCDSSMAMGHTQHQLAGVARRRGFLAELGDDTLRLAHHAVRADEVGIEHLAVRRADTLPAHEGRIGADLAHGSAEADRHPMERTWD